MGFKDITVAIPLAALFVLSLIVFGYSMQINNGVNDTFINNSNIQRLNTGLQSNLTGFQTEAQAKRTTFEGQTQQVGTADQSNGIGFFDQVKGFSSLMFGTYNVMTSGISNILGIPALVINIIGGALVITMLLLGWRVIRAGGM